MDLNLWLLFVLMFSSVLAIPGPNAAYAIGQTLSNGPRSGLVASAGFAFASGLNIVIVLTGLGLILSQFIGVLIYLKWMGVCYLLYMAYKAFTADPANPKPKGDIKSTRIFAFAVLVSLSNPKVILANLMLLPLFLVPEKSMVVQGAVISITGMLLSFFVYAAYALLASKFIAKLKTKTANRVVGATYTVAAGALASIQK